MGRLTFLVLVSLAAACASTPAARPPLEAPRRARGARCSLEEALLRCRWPTAASAAVVASDALAFAPRLGGGAFVLREGGVLERWDRHGRRTGSTSTAYEALAAAGPYACGVAGGAIACFRDRHEDLTCPDAPFAPGLEAVASARDTALVGTVDGPLLRTGRGAASRSYRIGGSCAQHCVRLGCGEPLRCMDPCRPGQAPRLWAEPLSPGPTEFFSEEGPVEATHPS